MKQLSLGAALAALVMFGWGFLYWGVLPFSAGALNQVPDQAGLQAVLKEALPASGVYLLPYADDPENADYQALHTAGPIATIFIRKDGSEPMAPSTFVMGYLHGLIVMFIMGLMLKLVAVESYAGRVTTVFLAGLAGSLYAQFAGPIWWLYPWDMAIANVIYESVAWLLGGMTLAIWLAPGGRRDSNEV